MPGSIVPGEVAGRLGYVPAIFASAENDGQAAAVLWQQFCACYFDNPLPALFKERLIAHLSRYCDHPYCLVVHSCRLATLGITGPQVLALLKQPMPTPRELQRQSAALRDSGTAAEVWPAADSVAEKVVFWLAVGVFLQRDRRGQCRQTLREFLGHANYDHLMSLLGFVKVLHLWVESHPEISAETDPLTQKCLPALLSQEPGLDEFFHKYSRHVQHERRNREARLAAEMEQQKWAREVLAASETRHRLALIHAPFPVMIYAEDGQIIQVNDVWAELSGFHLADTSTLAAWYARAEPERNPPGAEDIEALFSVDERVEEGEYEIKTRYGGTLIWDFTSAPLGRLPDGRRAIMRMAADVTERRELEAALWNANRRMSIVLDSISDGFFALDLQSRFVYVNDRALASMERGREELIGKPVTEVFPFSRQVGLYDAGVLARKENKTVAGGFQSPVTGRWYDYRIYPTADGISVFFQDVTDQKKLADKLEETHQFLETLINSSPLAVIAADTDAVVKLWSPAAERIFGWKADEVIGRTPPTMTQTEIAEFRVKRRQAAANGMKVHYEARRPTKDGRVLDVLVWGSPLRDGQGKDSGAMALIADVTERKRAQEALRQSEQRNRALLSAIPDLMFHLDRNGRYLDYVAVRESPLVPAGEFLGKTLRQILPGDVADALLAAIETALCSGNTQTLEYPLLVNGERRYYETRIAPCGESEVLMIVRNVTARRSAQEALVQVNLALTALLRSCPVGIVSLDLNGLVRVWNPAAERMFGWTEQEVIGQPLPIIPASRLQEYAARRRTLFQGAKPDPFVAPCAKKDGSEVMVSTTIAPVRDAQGQLISLMGILQIART